MTSFFKNSSTNICIFFSVVALVVLGGGKNFEIRGQNNNQSEESSKKNIKKTTLNFALEYLLDASESKTIEQIIESTEFKKSKKTSRSYGYPNADVWSKITVVIPKKNKRVWYLEVGYPLLDYATLYYLTKKKTDPDGDSEPEKYSIRKIELGDKFDFEKRELEHTYFMFPLKNKPGKYVYYLKVRSESSTNLPLAIKSKKLIIKQISTSKFYNGIFYGSMIVMILFNFLLFLGVKDKTYLFFVLYLLNFTLLSLVLDGNGFQYLWREFKELNNLAPFLMLSVIFWSVPFARDFLKTRQHLPRIDKALLYFGIISLCLWPLNFLVSYKYAIQVAIPVLIVGVLLSLLVGIMSHLKKVREARFFLIAWFFVLFGGLLALLNRQGVLENNFLTLWGFQFGLMLQISLISLGLADRINTLKNNLNELNIGLEEKVKQRTADLQKTLEEVNALKEQQDGDYFLTSLLIEPLTANKIQPGNIKVDFYIRQKKNFKFRNYTKDLGGDICICHTLELEDREYTVILNADAMGKSMQGAGGILVLGSVFQSIIERTKHNPLEKNQAPERWIKSTFVELNKVFESFNGSMLVSIVLGLVDNDSGLFYYINAEHPWTVLYRDAKASFIETELSFHKLGTGFVMNEVYIRTLQLEHGDILICGSDGRDDIDLGVNESGMRLINENEMDFLERVEEGGGDLDTIVDVIEKKGQLTDDLSLLKLSYSHEIKVSEKDTEGILSSIQKFIAENKIEEAQNFYLMNEDRVGLNEYLINPFVRYFLKAKDYKNAIFYLEKYLAIKPQNTEYFYTLSYCYKKVLNFKDAAHYGERVLLRNPGIVKNLLNLSEVHLNLKNIDRAEFLLKKALEIDRKNPKALKIEEIIKNKVT